MHKGSKQNRDDIDSNWQDYVDKSSIVYLLYVCYVYNILCTLNPI